MTNPLFGKDFIADEVFRDEFRGKIIKVDDKRLDWNKITFHKLDWDLEIRGLPYQIVRAEYHVDGKNVTKFHHPGYPLCHCIGGQYSNNNYYAYPLFKERTDFDRDHGQFFHEDLGPTRENLIEFNGDAPHWGIVAEGSHYFRKGEFKKGARVYITRNSKKFYEIMTGSISYGLSKAQYILSELQDHPCNILKSVRF